jgi:ABC-type proline/glycine betaine transport system substrate-binding protein
MRMVLALAVASSAAQLQERPFTSNCLAASELAVESTGAVVRLRWDDWMTSQLSTTVAAILLQERMGYDVRLVTPVGVTRNVYRDVANGAYDAAMEIWPAGKEVRPLSRPAVLSMSLPGAPRVSSA